MFRDKYKLQFPDRASFDEIQNDLSLSDTSLEFSKIADKISDITWIVSEYILGIVGDDKEVLQMDISVDYRATIPESAPLKKMVHRYSLRIKNTDVFDEYVDRMDVKYINMVCTHLTGLDRDDFDAVSIDKDNHAFIIEIKDGVEIPELDILTEYIYAEEE